jgi:hypothetical protein
VKLSYILKVTYPIATVMAKIYSLAMVIIALRSMVLAVYNSSSPFQAKALIRLLWSFGKGY